MISSPVLVTGATGFIAGHCIAELLARGCDVRGTVRDPARADVRHLHAAAARAGRTFELVEARLEADDGWDEAVAGCELVCHLASPVPAGVPDDEAEVIAPAVEGTRRVLRAAARGGVRRAVLMSSIDAIVRGHADATAVRTEADWSVAERCAPYPKSKTLAERAAWEVAADEGLELVALQPGLVVGPLLRTQETTSMEVIALLLGRKLPAVPRISFAVVDVRDVAAAVVLAAETPGAAGKRYILATPPMWMGEIADVLARHFGPRGYRIPRRTLPYWVMWLNARIDPVVRLALDYYGVALALDTSRAGRELGWEPRPADEAIVAAGESLLALTGG